MTLPPEGNRRHPEWSQPPPHAERPAPGLIRPATGPGPAAGGPATYGRPTAGRRTTPGGRGTARPDGPPGVLVGVVVLVAVLLLAGGAFGAWWLLRDPDRDGAPSAAAAVDAFLRAVYQDRNPAAATALVCSEARDEESLTTKIDSIRAYEGRYDGPRFTWTPPEVVEQSDAVATVAVTVTMITSDELSAEQPLRVSVLDKGAHGWWVCDVRSAAAEDGQPDGGASEPPGDGPSPGASGGTGAGGDTGEDTGGEGGGTSG